MQCFSGDFELIVFKDDINVDKNVEDYKVDKKEVIINTKIAIEMAAGGGWAVTISKKD